MAVENFTISIEVPSGQDIIGTFQCEAHTDTVAKKAADFVQNNATKAGPDWAVHISRANGDPWAPPSTVAEFVRK